MTAEVHALMPTDPVERALALIYDEKRVAKQLRYLYPNWILCPVRGGGWIAFSRVPISPAQRAAGVLPSFGRWHISGIAEVLAVMVETVDAGY